MRTASRSAAKSVEWAFYVLAGFIVLAFLTGGGARADIQSLLLLRPVAAFLLVFGWFRIDRSHVRAAQLPLAAAGGFLLLILVQLVPLPPFAWTHLSGREWVAALALDVGIEQPWRAINLMPDLGWNSFFAGLVPLAGLTWVALLQARWHDRVLSLLICLGLASVVLSVFQVVGDGQGWLHFYAVTNAGATGLFANRNHQALLIACLFPMLAAWASLTPRTQEQWKIRAYGAGVVGLFLVPLLLLTGSRAGVAGAAIGIAGGVWLFNRPEGLIAPRRRGGERTGIRTHIAIAAALLVTMAVGVTIAASRARALERIFDGNVMNDQRSEIWQKTWSLIVQYFPWGSGFGTFDGIFRRAETNSDLTRYYINHAHNDVLEVLMEGGAFAALLMAIAMVLWARKAFQIVFPDRQRKYEPDGLAKLGVVLTFILFIGSLFDYPLRVPSLALLFSIAGFWMFRPVPHPAIDRFEPVGRSGRKTSASGTDMTKATAPL